jgi:hypothetical protein
VKFTTIHIAAAAASLAPVGTVFRTLSYGATPAREGLYGPTEFALLASAAAASMALAFAAVSIPRADGS